MLKTGPIGDRPVRWDSVSAGTYQIQTGFSISGFLCVKMSMPGIGILDFLLEER